MTMKRNVTISIEVATYEAAKNSGVNVSEAAEKGILEATGVMTQQINLTDPLCKYIDVLSLAEKTEIAAFAREGKYKEPGVFGKTRRGDAKRRLDVALRVKYRLGRLDDSTLGLVVERLKHEA